VFISSANAGNAWQLEGFSFTAQSASTTLSFLGYTGNAYIGLDNVDVEPIVSPGVPEPSTWAMMLLGFAGVGFAGYRRARKSGAANAG